MEPERSSLAYDGKTIEYWQESRVAVSGPSATEPPIDPGENVQWYFMVDGVEYEVGGGGGDASRADVETLVKLFYLRGPGVANPGEARPRYCLRDSRPQEPADSGRSWLEPGKPYYGRPVEWTRTETGEVEIELAPPSDLDGALPVLVGSPYLVRLPPEELGHDR